MIPRRLIRTVPHHTSDEIENWWRHACDLHPGWQHITWRDPVDRDQFPITADLWDTCESGAQLADLIRAEDLWWRGGIYIDSDTQVYRSFTPLLPLDGFAAWEDAEHIPNAILGFAPNHPALREVLELARQRHHQGTWQAGVGVTTQVFADRDDMLLLPPGAFYPIHYREKDKTNRMTSYVRLTQPWAFSQHMWAHSWA